MAIEPPVMVITVDQLCGSTNFMEHKGVHPNRDRERGQRRPHQAELKSMNES
jgi:hypothetical protein